MHLLCAKCAAAVCEIASTAFIRNTQKLAELQFQDLDILKLRR